MGKRMEQLKTHKDNEESAIEAEEKDRKTEYQRTKIVIHE